MPEQPNLLDELGLDEQTLTWRHLALCKNMSPEKPGDPDLFFEEYEADVETAKAMDAVCLTCPVLKDCLLEATDNKDYGLRGGIFLNNGKTDKMRNAHKDDDVWAAIKEKLR